MTTVDLKKALLLCVYETYDESVREFQTACTRHCVACCTNRVIATTAEAALVLNYVEELGKKDLLNKALSELPTAGGQHVISMNALAEYCLGKQEPPGANGKWDTGPCQLMEGDECPVYQVRPLACRCMWSSQMCKAGGHAVMDPIMVSLAGVFQQIVEHVDSGGLYGNFAYLLAAMNDPKTAAEYRSGQVLNPTPFLVQTHPNPGFIVQPEHRRQIGGYLGRLWQREILGIPFKDALETVRKPGT
ncbi:MAG TPA: YkgJ family cysteine cluster protein [Desulfomonilaceae bacterium]|nr:YkgJ family cysteine cluster protein [Desulfomonilaceae bacterium]